ncbi:ABC transporter ATP-binding protein [Pontibacter fetidus]|uniref:ATP-binding cassette domain-containing protein n=1 Tax=Pontibacter fetidus TaxID=2700082 RepID=A0A6B2GX24_9BACT|nr:polysaccharide ABC transporter ATP-binding protein [Pontibacter fetidus]NDK54531.1 ATP-binding cassette domain-containing protein [Pontibacter fetidus]
MADKIIQVENISKLYHLGTIGTGSFRQDMQKWWNRHMLRKQDPFFDLATVNQNNKNRNYIWALKDVSFDVLQGESIGIIGSNGSGKSTLLKIISRITKPTTGSIKGRGKVSSLLEVGTGFNKELTGRENIFISGYILGMSKAEVTAKFDEIVAFSGIEDFIDTPVKRYSSGMYVRLAFAVAAHLEPDILIVDEVLAVGDADFQKKCLGKMREVSQADGRTILFVSHSMQAVKNLCDKAIWLNNGKLMANGPVSGVINSYLSDVKKQKLKQTWHIKAEAPGNEWIRMHAVELIPQVTDADAPLDIRVPLLVRIKFWNMTDNLVLSMGLHLFTYGGDCIFDVPAPAITCHKGIVEAECLIPGNFLNDGSYYISILILRDTSVILYSFEECISFELADYRENIQWYGKWTGAVRPKLPFKLKQYETTLHN